MLAAALISSARAAAGLSQRELGLRAGTSGSAVSFYESGERVPRVDTLVRLLAAANSTLLVAEHRAPSELDPTELGRRFRDVLSFVDGAPPASRAPLTAPVFRDECSRPVRDGGRAHMGETSRVRVTDAVC